MQRDRSHITTARRPHARKREGGIAMITVVLIIFLLMASALSSVDFTEQESRASGQSRATMRSLYAADAGIQLAIRRVQTGDFNAFTFALTDGTVVESRRRTDAAPQPLAGGGDDVGVGAPPDGYELGSYFMQVYPLNATAVGNNNLTSELEAKVGVLSSPEY